MKTNRLIPLNLLICLHPTFDITRFRFLIGSPLTIKYLAQKHDGANKEAEITLAKIFAHDSLTRINNSLVQLEE